LLRNRKWWIVLGALALLVLLAGCSPVTEPITTPEMKESGSWWTRNVVYWFSLMLDTFAGWFGGEYGLAILLLTIIVRTLILPLMIKQYKNTQAMQKLQPEMLKIREKYKDDPRRQQEEMMKLYQLHQVNPLAGCLPLLIQMPIFIALYNSIYMNQPIYEHTFLGLRLGLAPIEGQWYYYIIPVIAAITTWIQSKMMMAQNQGAMMGPMKGMMMIFPVLIFTATFTPSCKITSCIRVVRQKPRKLPHPKKRAIRKSPAVKARRGPMPNEKTAGIRQNGGRCGQKRSCATGRKRGPGESDGARAAEQRLVRADWRQGSES
jgi:YidC/Oxa1 family membrane protein insertase